MNVLIIGGNRFVGYLLTWRLLAQGDRVTLVNRGNIADPFGDRIERIRIDRTSAEFADALRGRTFDAIVDFAAFQGEDVRRIIELFKDHVGHYVFISTGQVYLVKQHSNWPAREEDYDGPIKPRPADAVDLDGWVYGVEKRAGEDLLVAAWQ